MLSNTRRIACTPSLLQSATCHSMSLAKQCDEHHALQEQPMRIRLMCNRNRGWLSTKRPRVACLIRSVVPRAAVRDSAAPNDREALGLTAAVDHRSLLGMLKVSRQH